MIHSIQWFKEMQELIRLSSRVLWVFCSPFRIFLERQYTIVCACCILKDGTLDLNIFLTKNTSTFVSKFWKSAYYCNWLPTIVNASYKMKCIQTWGNKWFERIMVGKKPENRFNDFLSHKMDPFFWINLSVNIQSFEYVNKYWKETRFEFIENWIQFWIYKIE